MFQKEQQACEKLTLLRAASASRGDADAINLAGYE